MQARAIGVFVGLVASVSAANVALAEDGRSATLKMASLNDAPSAFRAGVSMNGLVQQSADINMDRIADQQIFVDVSGQTRAAIRDLDFDGRADVVEFFSPSGEVLERQFQMDFDPFVDVVRLYEKNRLTQKLVATSFDGSLSLEKYYDIQGNLSRTARDTNFDGRADLWEYYSEGKVVNITRDLNGDGEAETIEEVESK
jgi:hypothetical protein